MVPSDFIVAAAVQLQLRARPLAAQRKALTSSSRVEAAATDSSPAPALCTPRVGAREGTDLDQQGSSSSSPAPALHTPLAATWWREGRSRPRPAGPEQGSSSSSPALAQRTPPGGAKEGADLVQQVSSSSSPVSALAPCAPPGGAKEGTDLVQQGSSSHMPALHILTPSAPKLWKSDVHLKS